jgi:hypothetical protein
MLARALTCFSSLACVIAPASLASAEPQKPSHQSQFVQPVEPEKSAPADAPAQREVFPGVRVDVVSKLVEIDGSIAIDAHRTNDKGQTLVVFLETLVCTRDSKEHESLVVTDAKASQVHAALLLVGLKPGEPGRWEGRREGEKNTLVGIAPKGDAVRVTIAPRNEDGSLGDEVDALEWVVNQRDARPFRAVEPDAALVFAGSKMVKPRRRMIDPERSDQPEVYAGDLEGTIVGLTSFGTETIGVTAMYNPDAGTQEPEWIARGSMPAMNTRVLLRVRPAK